LGIVFLLNLEIGYMTPPVGLNLFISSFRFGKPVTELYRAVLPFIGLLMVALAIVTYYEPLSTSLVNVMRDRGLVPAVSIRDGMADEEPMDFDWEAGEDEGDLDDLDSLDDDEDDLDAILDDLEGDDANESDEAAADEADEAEPEEATGDAEDDTEPGWRRAAAARVSVVVVVGLDRLPAVLAKLERIGDREAVLSERMDGGVHEVRLDADLRRPGDVF